MFYLKRLPNLEHFEYTLNSLFWAGLGFGRPRIGFVFSCQNSGQHTPSTDGQGGDGRKSGVECIKPYFPNSECFEVSEISNLEPSQF